MAHSSDEPSWSVRVGATGKDRATIYARAHRLDAGAPISFDEKHGRLTALELFLGAIGADLVNGLTAAADRRRVEIDRVEAVVEARLENPLVPLGVIGEPGSPRIEVLNVTIHVSSDAPADAVHASWSECLERSVLHHTLRRTSKLELRLELSL
jgi:hypothetical protein